jgi:hypothetical protein
MSCSKACRCSELCTNKPFRKEKKTKIVKVRNIMLLAVQIFHSIEQRYNVDVESFWLSSNSILLPFFNFILQHFIEVLLFMFAKGPFMRSKHVIVLIKLWLILLPSGQ